MWHIIERSPCLIHIVDARNQLFYFSEDLCAYSEDDLSKRFSIKGRKGFITLSPVEAVEYLSVQSRVHTLARSTGTEGVATSRQCL